MDNWVWIARNTKHGTVPCGFRFYTDRSADLARRTRVINLLCCLAYFFPSKNTFRIHLAMFNWIRTENGWREKKQTAGIDRIRYDSFVTKNLISAQHYFIYLSTNCVRFAGKLDNTDIMDVWQSGVQSLNCAGAILLYWKWVCFFNESIMLFK